MKQTLINMKNWIIERSKERTTLDGLILLSACVAFLIVQEFTQYVAYFGIGYSLWTMWKKEKIQFIEKLVPNIVEKPKPKPRAKSKPRATSKSKTASKTKSVSKTDTGTAA